MVAVALDDSSSFKGELKMVLSDNLSDSSLHFLSGLPDSKSRELIAKIDKESIRLTV